MFDVFASLMLTIGPTWDIFNHEHHPIYTDNFQNYVQVLEITVDKGITR